MVFQTDRETDWGDRATDRKADDQAELQTFEQKGREMVRQTDKNTQTGRQIDGQKGRQTGGKAERQT